MSPSSATLDVSRKSFDPADEVYKRSQLPVLSAWTTRTTFIGYIGWEPLVPKRGVRPDSGLVHELVDGVHADE